MVVMTQTPRVLELRRSVMEWHLINHPLDCPVCDQAGECWLQIYYMQHGLYEPRMIDDKVHKPKAVPIGPHVMLDAERCILCSRCVRFCDTITKTGELGIFNRGDHSELGLFPGTSLDNAYSGNVVDICPVGALTDRDFRFQARVWYLDRAKSVCPGCARGCNIEVHTNTKRAHHAQGRRVVRLKPRFNPDVNQWWICDEGRYGFGDVDAPTRLERPELREGGTARALTWEEAVAAVADGLRAAGPAGTGVLFSSRMSNEDLWLARRLFVDTLGAAHADFRVPPRAPGSAGRPPAGGRQDPEQPGRRRCSAAAGRARPTGGTSSRPRGRAGSGSSGSSTTTSSTRAGPGRRWRRRSRGSRAWSSRARTPTGRARGPTWSCRARPTSSARGPGRTSTGRVQRFWRAVLPRGEARPDWEILAAVARAARPRLAAAPGGDRLPRPGGRDARLRGR